MKICPDCQKRYGDDVEVCPDDGEDLVDLPDELSGNPKLQEPVPTSPADRTSMIDLEAIEAKRKKKAPVDDANGASDGADGGDGVSADEKTPPPVEPFEDDPDGTGTLHRTKNRKRKKAKAAAEVPPTEADERSALADDAGADEIPEENRVNEELTNKDMSRSRMSRRSKAEASRVAQSRIEGTNVGTRAGTKAGTRAGTQMKAPPKPKKRLSAAQVGFLVVVVAAAIIGGVVLIARSTAVLTVTTVPPGAAVTLDGQSIGASPVQKRVRTGSHSVELVLDGYEPYKEVVDVPPEGLPFLQPLQKKPPPPPPPPSPSMIASDMARQAQILFEGGDLEGAKKKIDEALGVYATCVECKALLEKVDAAIAKKGADRAKEEAAGARAERLRQARVLAEEGHRLYEANQLGAAKDKLYASLKLDPENPEPHRTLGRIFNREDDVDKVRYHLQRYLDLGGADGDFKVREWLKSHPK